MAIYNGGLSIKNVSISIDGNGNAITSLSADGNVITATRGTTFLTSSSLSNYVTTTTFNSTIGDINSILDNINGEVV